MIQGLHHAALAVPSMDDALAFYCGVVGFEVVMEAQLPAGIMEVPFAIDHAGCAVRMIQKNGTRIELFQFEQAKPGDASRPVNQIGITHIALASDDVPKDVATLEAAGVKFNTPVQGDSPNQWCYGRDPFGNVIEIIEAAG